MKNIRFLFELVRAYGAACDGITSAALSLSYWADAMGGTTWKLVFVPATDSIRVFALEQGTHWRTAAQLDMEVGVIRLQEGAAEFWSAEEHPELDATLHAMQDLCEPCQCIASDHIVLAFFGTSVQCRCGRGWLAAVQRGAKTNSRCPFTGMDFGDGAAQHPSWSQWMARWHCENPL